MSDLVSTVHSTKVDVKRPRFMITLRPVSGEAAFIAWVGDDEAAALDTYRALMTPGQVPELYERRPVVMV